MEPPKQQQQHPSKGGGGAIVKKDWKRRIARKWHGYFEQLAPSQRPIPLQDVPEREGLVNHSYADFSHVPPPPAEWNNEAESSSSSSSSLEGFGEKVHAILSAAQQDSSYAAPAACLCWMPHGRSFRIRSQKSFEVQVCPRYFGHGKLSLFIKDLTKHGFRYITKGQDKGCKYTICCYRCCFYCRCRLNNDDGVDAKFVRQVHFPKKRAARNGSFSVV